MSLQEAPYFIFQLKEILLLNCSDELKICQLEEVLLNYFEITKDVIDSSFVHHCLTAAGFCADISQYRFVFVALPVHRRERRGETRLHDQPECHRDPHIPLFHGIVAQRLCDWQCASCRLYKHHTVNSVQFTHVYEYVVHSHR